MKSFILLLTILVIVGCSMQTQSPARKPSSGNMGSTDITYGKIHSHADGSYSLTSPRVIVDDQEYKLLAVNLDQACQKIGMRKAGSQVLIDDQVGDFAKLAKNDNPKNLEISEVYYSDKMRTIEHLNCTNRQDNEINVHFETEVKNSDGSITIHGPLISTLDEWYMVNEVLFSYDKRVKDVSPKLFNPFDIEPSFGDYGDYKTSALCSFLGFNFASEIEYYTEFETRHVLKYLKRNSKSEVSPDPQNSYAIVSNYPTVDKNGDLKVKGYVGAIHMIGAQALPKRQWPVKKITCFN